MSTILTDDEIQAEGRNGFGIDPVLDGHLMKFARAVEAAVLAKLAQLADRQRVTEGWKLVPVEPTDEQLAILNPHLTHTRFSRYKALLAAAPEAPAQADERAAFEAELRRQCFQKPTTEARDLAWCMWQARAAIAKATGEKA